MAWTYSGDPTTSPRDEVRFLLGDTNSSQPQLQDAEIQYNISSVYGANPPAQGNYLPAAYCADNLAAKYSRAVDKSVGVLRVSYNQRVKQYQALAIQLRTRATLGMVKPYVGGASISDKRALQQDPDRVGAAVQVDGMDHEDPLSPIVGDPNVP